MRSRSARAGLLSCWLLLAAAVVFSFAACGDKKTSIAELQKAEGPVEREAKGSSWTPAKVGTKFYIGDAVRTADGSAQLLVLGGAQLAMQPHTVLRFGGTDGNSKISVELGAIDLTGTGSYGLDVGDVRLSKGSVRITATGEGESSIELTIGDAQISRLNGQILDLVIGVPVGLSIDDVQISVVDAGVPDAPAVAPDAPVVASSDEATVEITGKKAEIQAPGTTTWTPLPAGAGLLAKGSKIRIGNNTTAKLTANGTTLSMAGGSRATLSDDMVFFLESGEARTSVPAAVDGKITVPGGAVAMKGEKVGAEARVTVNARESRINVLRGNVRLTGANGGELAMNRGETATVAKVGTIRVVEAIPTYFDFKVSVGDTVTIHDPKGATAVQFTFGGKCPEGGFIEMDKDPRYRTAKVSAGKDAANVMVGAGGWAYRLRCSSGGGDTAAVGSGRIVVLRDSGNRALPKQVAVNNIDPDGRNWRISYQSVIPTVVVSTKGTGSSFKLHVATGGKEQVFEGKGSSIKVPGNKLDEGTYTYWLDRDGVKDPKVSTLTIDFDNTAPQVYIQKPVNNREWETPILVRGAVLPGWSAAVDGVTIPIDNQRRFNATVQQPAGKALAIRLSHPQRGVHYYLRRGK